MRAPCAEKTLASEVQTTVQDRKIHPMRRFIAPLLILPLLLSAPAPAAELLRAEWPSRKIDLEPAEEGLEPPVVTALGLQANGELVATAGDDHLVRVWNRETGELAARLEGHIDWIRTAAFTPDGKELITAGNDRRIYRWDVNNQWQRTMLAEHDQAVVSLAIHPAGDRIAVVGFDGRLRVYDLSGETLAEWACPCKDMRTVIFSPDGIQLAAAGRNGKIAIWNSGTGEELVKFEAHRQRIRALVYTIDGERLISAGEDRMIKGWNPRTGTELFSLNSSPSKVQSLALLSRNQLASAGSDNRIRLWNLDTLTSTEYLHGHTGSVVAMQSNGEVLVSGAFDASVRVWTVADGNALSEPTTPVTTIFPFEGSRFELPASEEEPTAAPATEQPTPFRGYGPTTDTTKSIYQP